MTENAKQRPCFSQFRWLSAPSLGGSHTLGGWTPGNETYAWPNDKPTNLAQYVDVNNSATYTDQVLSADPVNPLLKTFRGKKTVCLPTF
jgi:hypothetical protein|eukprot:COSAG06_NODE_304_length_17855_cov_47.399414_12_plen_89_part_00